jgi:hypothetical protein
MPIRSPCIGKCFDIDYKKRICLGCYRSSEEIAKWFEMTDTDRRAALKLCKQRSKEHHEKPGGKHGS